MKILQIVPLVTPSGAYGGPITVAVNQSRELRRRGHDVHIAGAASGYSDIPEDLADVPAHLFPARNYLPASGFAGLFSRGLYRWFQAHHRSFDVIHFHLSRSLTTLPLTRLARRSGTRYVTQTHGMIDASKNPLAIPLDAVLTRPALRAASTRFYLTPREEEDLAAMLGSTYTLSHLANGVPVAEGVLPGEIKGDAANEVLYLARLHRRKRPLAFVAVAETLSDEIAGSRFTLIGPDEGEGQAVARAISEIPNDRVSWKGPLPPTQTTARMAEASVYVLPSVDEPYPMSVLEAMSVGLPVIVTDSCGLASEIERTGSGIVVDESVQQLEDAIRLLLTDHSARLSMGASARAAAEGRFSMMSIAEQLESAYSVDGK